MPSVRFGKYQVLVRLVAGGGGTIYLAREEVEQPVLGSRSGEDRPPISAPDGRCAPSLPRLVCLKLPQETNRDAVAAFLDEARLAAQMHHTHCVQIYEIGRERGVHYIAMEHVFGETLNHLMDCDRRDRELLPRAVVVRIVASACAGLHHAHVLEAPDGRPHHLIHRDVAPPNIMISFEGETKVLDFGIAKAISERETKTGVIKGRAAYMSPEQITGRRIDHRSDIYSLGVILHECLSRERLYSGMSVEQIAWKKHKASPPRLSLIVEDIEVELEEITRTALLRDRDKRYQTAREMGEALESYLSVHAPKCDALTVAEQLRRNLAARFQERNELLDRARCGEDVEAQLIETFDARPVTESDFSVSEDMLDLLEAPTAADSDPDPDPDEETLVEPDEETAAHEALQADEAIPKQPITMVRVESIASDDAVAVVEEDDDDDAGDTASIPPLSQGSRARDRMPTPSLDLARDAPTKPVVAYSRRNQQRTIVIVLGIGILLGVGVGALITLLLMG